MIPLFHDFHNKRVVVIGGGTVAARKAETFAREADVTVVAPSFHHRIHELDCSRVEMKVDATNIDALIEDAFLVIPATDDQSLNDEITARARETGSLVNRVDTVGETISPSVVETPCLTVAISTGGRSPAVCKYLRDRLQPEVQRANGMVEIQEQLRETLADRPQNERREIIWRVLDDEDIWEALEAGEIDRANARTTELL